MLSFLHVLPPLLLRPVLLCLPPLLLVVLRPLALGVPPLLLSLACPPQDGAGEQVAQRFPAIDGGK